MRFLFVISIVSSSFIGCSVRKENLKLAASSKGATYFNVANTLSEVLADEGFRIEVLSGERFSTIPNLRLIGRKEADLAFVQNDTPVEAVNEIDSDFISGNIRTVLPVYPEILFIVYPDTLSPGSLRELIIGRKIGIGPESSGTARFMKEFFSALDIDSSAYTPVYTSFDDNLLSNPDIDVSCSLTGFNNSRISRMLDEEHGAIFSLDNYEFAFKGSAVDGFCFNYPRAKPFLIPKRTFGLEPSEPVLTLAVDALLVTHKDTDANLIYDLIEGIFQKSQQLTNRNVLLSFLSEEFDPARLNFPLHEGVKMYLERDEPAFYERYAEVTGVCFSILLVVAGGISSWSRKMKMVRKNRIDSYYFEVLEIESRLNEYKDPEDVKRAIESVRMMKKEVYLKLIDEKIPADESFNHFIILANEVIIRLETMLKKETRFSAHTGPW